MTPTWFTPTLASALMMTGGVAGVLNLLLLYDDRNKPGVVWFLLSMVFGALWAMLFATFTIVSDPGLTLALANVFWAVIPAASVSMFLLAYEYVSSRPPPRLLIGVMFAPVVFLFVLSWVNPNNLVHTTAYYVDPAGILHFPSFGGPVKVLVVKAYGYLLFTIAAGILVGEVIRTPGARRRETMSILVVFSTLAASTLVKVANLVPIYFDPTSVVFSLSGFFFAVSTHRSGFLKMVTIAREQAFEQVQDAILIVDSSGVILDANHQAKDLFGSDVVSQTYESVLGAGHESAPEEWTLAVDHERKVRYYSVQKSSVQHFRDAEGKVVVLTDITAVKNRELDLELFKQVLVRIFRHNLRNDLNVVSGYADLISLHAKGDLKEYAEKIQSNTEGLIAKTNKARAIEWIFTDERMQDLSLQVVVEDAVASFDFTQHEATVQTDVADERVRANPRLELAVRELVENAVVHNDAADEPAVQIYTRAEHDALTLYVEDNGPGIPQSELQVLDAEKETDLRHGSGIGLWLVHWIVKRSDGELISRTTDSGTCIGIRLHAASTPR